jgi:FUN14 family
LAYLQYQQILNINWNKLQATSQNAVTMLANATTQISNHINYITDTNINHATNSLAISNFGIPLTGSMAMGIAVGFMKG